MTERKVAYPEAGEFVLGTVDNVFKQGAFIKLDEYANRSGMLHISEISLKWVRNIRDFVKEGQKVVLQVLKVNPEKGHVDLSLRRVSDMQRKLKLKEVKETQRSGKLLELLAKELGASHEEVAENVSKKLLAEYDSVYAGLEAISADPKAAAGLNLSKEWESKLVEVVEANIKSPIIEVTGFLELSSFAGDGVDKIGESLKAVHAAGSEEYSVSVSYVSAPIYRVRVRGASYKGAERVMKSAADAAAKAVAAGGGVCEFHKERPK